MRYRMRTFLRLWWRRDLAWRRALIRDTLRGRLELRGAQAHSTIRLEKPPGGTHIDPSEAISRLIVCVWRMSSAGQAAEDE